MLVALVFIAIVLVALVLRALGSYVCFREQEESGTWFFVS